MTRPDNSLVDTIAIIAAILSVGASIDDVRRQLAGETRQPPPLDRDLVQSAQELLEAAYDYVNESESE